VRCRAWRLGLQLEQVATHEFLVQRPERNPIELELRELRENQGILKGWPAVEMD
jgi:hypothetical protein